MIKSPITGKNNVRKLESLKCKDILRAYEEFGPENIQRFFSGLEEVSIYECLDTKYRFYYPFSISGDEKFYAFLQDRVGYYGTCRWEHDIAFAVVEPGQKVLEIGCGTGDFLERLKKQKNSECVGLEFNLQAIKATNEKDLEVRNEPIESHAEGNRNKYDIVCSFQVLEHICDVKSFLGSSIDCLKEHGMLIVGVPNNNPYLFQNDKFHTLNLPPHHMGLWDKESLENIEKFLDIKLERLLAEPLFDADYFWKVKLKHWKDHNKTAYALAKCIPTGLTQWRNRLLKKICDGRNLLAMYRKI